MSSTRDDNEMICSRIINVEMDTMGTRGNRWRVRHISGGLQHEGFGFLLGFFEFFWVFDVNYGWGSTESSEK